MSLLTRWFARRAHEPVPVRLVTGSRCPLCEEMRAELARADVSRRIALEVVRIEDDRELKRRYGLRIPVLEIDGEEAFVGRAAAREIRARVRAAERRRRRKAAGRR